ncbi:MAG: hypothetical protein ACREID_04625 [Planctomycetota bacterium]
MEGAVAEPAARPPRAVADFLSSLAFVTLIAGLTYFAILVFNVRFGADSDRAAAYHEIGLFLSGGLPPYQDARVFGAASLVLALLSILFGVTPLARITLLLSGSIYALFLFYGDPILRLLDEWAQLAR